MKWTDAKMVVIRQGMLKWNEMRDSSEAPAGRLHRRG
jgi:hypothetical protein